MNTLELVAAIVGSNGLTAIVTTALTGRFNRAVNAAAANKSDNDAAQAIAIAATTLVKPLEERVAKLEQENTENRRQLSSAFDYIRVLHAWISRHIPGRTPPAPPADLRVDLT